MSAPFYDILFDYYHRIMAFSPEEADCIAGYVTARLAQRDANVRADGVQLAAQTTRRDGVASTSPASDGPSDVTGRTR